MEEQQKQSLRNVLNYCIENFKKEQAVERIVEYIDDSLKLKEIEFKLLNTQRVSKPFNTKTGVCKKCKASALETYIDGKECTSCGNVC